MSFEQCIGCICILLMFVNVIGVEINSKIHNEELLLMKVNQARVKIVHNDFLNVTKGETNDQTYLGYEINDDIAIQCTGDIDIIAMPGKCVANVDLSNVAKSRHNSQITNNAPKIFPVGKTNVTFFADGDSCSILVSVRDMEPPSILHVSVSKDMLWPPNHQFHTIDVDIVTWDNCASTTSEIHCAVTEVSQNEKSEWVEMEGGPYCGVGGATFDILAPLAVNICAERNFGGVGRIYTISGFCKDDQNEIVTPFETKVNVPIQVQ